MFSLNDLNGFGEEMEERLQLRTSPVAVMLLKKEGDIPAGAIRPKRDRGSHLALCQAFAMSRREKATVAMLREDHWCYLPVIAFGLSEAPDYFLEGNTFVKFAVSEPQAAKDLAKALPRLECGKNIGVLSAPLSGASFQPDVVVIYCNTNQLRCLLSAVKYKDGYLVQSTLDPGGACFQATVPVLQKGECQVTVPCGGDRAHAMARDDEMIFSVPNRKLEDLMFGLRALDEAGRGYTRFAPDMRPEYPLSDVYLKAGALVGLEVKRK
ncbi:MAG: DUF169 domain-containing protein [Syntrophales bacterium LBB04]|nr:DUF169 domain-containing protein [Syntrophales bacterium LBB04]